MHPSQPVVFTGDTLGRIDQWFLLDTCLDRSGSTNTTTTTTTSNTSNTTNTFGREKGRRIRIVELTSPVEAARGADA